MLIQFNLSNLTEEKEWCGMNKMTSCTTCGAQIAANAKVCPSCGASNKPPVHKRAWFWVLIVFVALGLIGGLTGGTQQTEGQTGGTSGASQAGGVPAAPDSSSQAAEPEPEVSVFAGDNQVAVTAEMGASIIEFPQLTVRVQNNAPVDVAAIQFYAVPYDAYGEEITGWTREDRLYTDRTIPAGGSDTVEFQFIEDSVKTVRLYVYSVYFTDGTEWGDRNATEKTILSEAVEIPVDGEA